MEALRSLLEDLEVAPVYETEPVLQSPDAARAHPPYLNTVAAGRLREPIAARSCRARLTALARAAGRGPGRGPDGQPLPRPLDVDLLICGGLEIDLRELEDPAAAALPSRWPGAIRVPHPRLRERLFVLAPLHDLAPGLAVPPDGQPVASLLAALEGQPRVRRIGSRASGR
ncbi:MAG: 2-amino-4-hydroxy-6-hydroxymethyldihydropteridine diphosphokinase [Acidobacteriota bacterium]